MPNILVCDTSCSTGGSGLPLEIVAYLAHSHPTIGKIDIYTTILFTVQHIQFIVSFLQLLPPCIPLYGGNSWSCIIIYKTPNKRAYFSFVNAFLSKLHVFTWYDVLISVLCYIFVIVCDWQLIFTVFIWIILGCFRVFVKCPGTHSLKFKWNLNTITTYSRVSIDYNIIDVGKAMQKVNMSSKTALPTILIKFYQNRLEDKNAIEIWIFAN